jgi:hypothetical protein
MNKNRERIEVPNSFVRSMMIPSETENQNKLIFNQGLRLLKAPVIFKN